MTASERLGQLGITLPAVPLPVAAYVPAIRAGNLVLSSGQLPFVDGVLAVTGRVGSEVDESRAAGAARTATLNALAAVAGVSGGIDEIGQVLKVTVFVASADGFHNQAAVANGASHLLGEVFGDAGAHVRSAVGVAALPLNAPVEVELVATVR